MISFPLVTESVKAPKLLAYLEMAAQSMVNSPF